MGNILLITTAERGWWNKHSYVEAYDIQTGQPLWIYEQENANYIYSFLIVNRHTIVFRSHGEITALNIKTGDVLWKNATNGSLSVHYGEGWD